MVDGRVTAIPQNEAELREIVSLGNGGTVKNALYCGKCERQFNTPQGFAVHNARLHGVRK